VGRSLWDMQGPQAGATRLALPCPAAVAALPHTLIVVLAAAPTSAGLQAVADQLAAELEEQEANIKVPSTSAGG